MHGDDDQIVPYADSAPLSAKLLKNGTLKTYKGFPHGMPTTQADTINADLLAFLIVPRDWSVMRRRAAAKVQTNFIDIAPSPPFRRIVAFDDGMAGLAKMLGGVTVWRAVAAADMAARPAEAQMHPGRTDLQTLLATERARCYVTDGSGVRTFAGH
jgi:hypothetical protein